MSVGERVAPVSFRLPLGVRLFSLAGVVVLGAASLLGFGFLVAVLVIDQWVVAVVTALCTAVMVTLTHYVARDLHGKWSLRVALGADSVELSLPRNRSLIHTTLTQRVIVPYADIAAIETRLEAYPSFGMVSMQRPYVLRRKDGGTIFLFEERAIGTGMQSSYFGAIVREIAARAQAPVRDLGMSEGSGGVLGVVHTHEADWAAPALPLARQNKLAQRAYNTGAWAFLLVTAAFMVRWAIAVLR
jgi:hypothetical protein